MKIVSIQAASWEKPEIYSSAIVDLVKGDLVIIEKDGKEEVSGIIDPDFLLPPDTKPEELPMIKRKTTGDDLARLSSQADKEKAIGIAKDMAERLGLEMKFVDVYSSLDHSRMNFAFIADGRVDFRTLVKDMISYFNANIRLTQIGARDEARLCGDCGGCGRPLCCRGCVKNFSSVTSEMAEAQKIAHRGSDRISGMCGRLMCCLSYEFENYKRMEGELPPLGTVMKVKGREGKVISHNIIKRSVNVKFEGKKEKPAEIVEVKI